MLEAQILSSFLSNLAQIPLETSQDLLKWWCGLGDDVAQHYWRIEPSWVTTMMC